MARPAGFDPHAPRGDDLKVEIAAAAARLIAEEGFDYAGAKRKAARAILGDTDPRSALPDNALVESELRRYLSTFAADSHPPLLAAFRRLALEWMERLAAFNPHLTGAVLNGTATEHSDIHLDLFTDSAKDVEIFLLNQGFEFDVEDGEDGPGGAVETLVFVARTPARSGLPPRVGVHLDVHTVDAIRVPVRARSSEPGLHAVEAAGRASIGMLRTLIADAASER